MSAHSHSPSRQVRMTLFVSTSRRAFVSHRCSPARTCFGLARVLVSSWRWPSPTPRLKPFDPCLRLVSQVNDGKTSFRSRNFWYLSTCPGLNAPHTLNSFSQKERAGVDDCSGHHDSDSGDQFLTNSSFNLAKLGAKWALLNWQPPSRPDSLNSYSPSSENHFI